MTVNHDAVAALPISSGASQTLVRNVFVARMPYVLFDADDSRNLIAVDPTTGAIIIDLMLFGRVFHYDPTDTTTAHDGTSCLVSADGKRYKLAVGTDVFAYAVLDNTVATPPGSPTLGDAYLVAAGATGAWAGKSNFIAVKTNRGWEFVNFSIGRFIYVESVDTYFHKNAGGAWVTGFGNQVTTPNSVPMSAAINFGKRVIVENQTTTVAPGSPTVGTAYVIGAGATGAWAGLDGKIAICEVAGSFVIYTPTEGFAAYDKTVKSQYSFRNSAWQSDAGVWIFFNSVATPDTSNTNTAVSSTIYTYSDTTAPKQGNNFSSKLDNVTLTRAARRTGALLRFRYSMRLITTSLTASTAGFFTVGLFMDSVTNAIAWQSVLFVSSTTTTYGLNVSFEAIFAAPDTASHVYQMQAFDAGVSAAVANLGHRLFTIEEAS